MAEIESSSLDMEALKAAAETWPGLRDALSEVADEVAGNAKAHVAVAHPNVTHRGVGWKVSTKLYTDGMPHAVVRAPAGAFLGTVKGERHQTRAWGHVTSLWHTAADYVLADAASVMTTTSLF